MQVQRLILASASSFRFQLLTSTGLKFECETSRVDERKIVAQSAEHMARERAVAKAHDVARRHPDALVIGADQVLGIGNKAIDKANSLDEARLRLTQLAGKSHALQSAFCLVTYQDGHVKTLHSELVTAHMHMRPLNDVLIDKYLETGEWEGCVGCYRYEGAGINLFEKVEGDHSTIIGMPLVPLLSALRKLGIDPLLTPRPPWNI